MTDHKTGYCITDRNSNKISIVKWLFKYLGLPGIFFSCHTMYELGLWLQIWIYLCSLLWITDFVNGIMVFFRPKNNGRYSMAFWMGGKFVQKLYYTIWKVLTETIWYFVGTLRVSPLEKIRAVCQWTCPSIFHRSRLMGDVDAMKVNSGETWRNIPCIHVSWCIGQSWSKNRHLTVILALLKPLRLHETL